PVSARGNASAWVNREPSMASGGTSMTASNSSRRSRRSTLRPFSYLEIKSGLNSRAWASSASLQPPAKRRKRKAAPRGDGLGFGKSPPILKEEHAKEGCAGRVQSVTGRNRSARVDEKSPQWPRPGVFDVAAALIEKRSLSLCVDGFVNPLAQGSRTASKGAHWLGRS